MDRRLKLVLIGAGALVIFGLLNVIGQAINTLDRLTYVERERDRWQRAPEILAALNLHDGSRVVDLGCGAGYFALKLSKAVGASGTVQAVDIIRMPLVFLWIRAFGRGAHNLSVVSGTSGDPQLSGTVDSVLVVNTWHELASPEIPLGHLRPVLIPGGRLVIADRAPGKVNSGHAIDPALVEEKLTHDGFEIQDRRDHFLDQPGEGPWWLLVARKAYL